MTAQNPKTVAPPGKHQIRDIVHIPVLLQPILQVLQQHWGDDWSGKQVLDGTFGGGGYTAALLRKGAHVIAFDLDATAITKGESLKQQFPNTLSFHHGSFAQMEDVCTKQNITPNAIVLDLGISSDQLDNPQRGLTYQQDGPLDMTLSGTGQTAADILNTASERRLTEIFKLYGEEPRAKKLANLIITQRQQTPYSTTLQFRQTIEDLYPIPPRGQSRRHPAQRLFQALRIVVNNELEALETAITAASNILPVGGMLLIVTFHSLEDRLVKQKFKDLCVTEEDHLGRQTKAASFKIIVRKIKPTEEELEHNIRARSATLRVLQRVSA